MSEQKFNDLVKRMLDFGHPEPKIEEEKDIKTGKKRKPTLV